MHNNKWTVLVYTLILVFLSMIMAMVIFNIAATLSANSDSQNISSRLSRGVLGKWDLAIKYSKRLNSNGSGFIDDISCPTSITMSGASNIQSWLTSVLTYEDKLFFCSGSYLSDPFAIYFNTWFTDLEYAEYDWDAVAVSSGIGVRDFFDSDNTRINFSSSYPLASDGIDDNFNSDNYSLTSTGIAIYPNDFQDDDVDARKLIYWYANSDAGFVNIFWSNLETSTYIENNTNNLLTSNLKIWDVNNGHIVLDVNSNFKLKLYRFDRTQYNETRELFTLDILNSDEINGGIGYIQDDAWVLSLSSTKTWNEYSFDFQNNDYGLFLQNTSTWALLYSLRGESSTGVNMYINPIDDSDDIVIKVLANEMIIKWGGQFFTEQFEVVDFK